MHPIVGGEQIARAYAEIARVSGHRTTFLEYTVNGLPGLVAQQDGDIATVFAFEIAGDRIRRIWAVRNPEKLLPPAGHRAEPALSSDGLLVTVVNKGGYTKEYDFAELPVAGPMRGSLAMALAAQSRGWTSHRSADTYWGKVRLFAAFVSGLDCPPDELDGLTVATMQSWRGAHAHRRRQEHAEPGPIAAAA